MWERVWSGPQPVWMLCLDSKKTFLSNVWWGECAEGRVGGGSGGGVLGVHTYMWEGIFEGGIFHMWTYIYEIQ